MSAIELRKGVLLLLLAYFLYACADATAKWLVASITIWHILGMRSLFGLLGGLCIGGKDTIGKLFSHQAQWQLLPMNLCNLAGWACYYTAASDLDLPQLYSLYYLTPLLCNLLAGPMLGERVGLAAWLCCILGFIGVMIGVPPTSGNIPLHALIPGLMTPVFWAITAVLYRRNVKHYSDADLISSNNLLMLFSSALLLTSSWQALGPDNWWMLVLVGVLGSLAHWLYVMSIRRLPLAMATPVSFSSMFWSILLGFLIWGTWPSWNLWLGSALILLAAVLTLVINQRSITVNSNN